MKRFRISFAIGIGEKMNDIMRRVDLLAPGGYITNSIMTITVGTSSTLPSPECKALIAKTIKASGAKLYEIKEIV